MLRTLRLALVGVFASMLALGALDAEDFKITYRLSSKVNGVNEVEVEYHSQWHERTVNKARGRDTLYDYRDLVRYDIDHARRVVEKTSLADEYQLACILQDRLAEALSSKNGWSAAFAKMFFSPKKVENKLSVKRLGNEAVAGRNCEIWKITVGKASCRVSIDPGLVSPTPADALEEAARLEASVLMIPPADDASGRLCIEMAKLKGTPLKTETRLPFFMFTFKESSEATKVEPGPIPASVFELPKGYAVEDVGKRDLETIAKMKRLSP
jgi:hypothetical protein